MRKHRFSRRDFIRLSGTGLAGLTCTQWPIGIAAAALSAPQEPDLIVFNAKVFTVDPIVPQAEAFAVKAGRFVAVGSTDDVKSLAGKQTQTFDAQQATIVPGFIDAHNHAPGGILLYDVLVGNPYDVEFVAISSIVDKLRARARETPAGGWVEGFFFDDTKVKDRRPLSIHDLDQVSQEHPVSVRHRGGHTTYYNSKAFELAGVTKDTVNSAAGTYDRDENGNFNGRVTDRARDVFLKVGKRTSYSPEQTRARNRDALSFISKQFVRYGLTSVHHEGGDLAALQQVRARGDLLHRVSYEAAEDFLEAMIKNGISTGFGDEWIRLGATYEHNCDGSFSERTMALSVPYPNVSPPYKGNVVTTQQDLDAWVERVHRAGIQVNCHANGDVAIDMALTAFERAQRLFPRPDPRPKITHCTLINDALLRRIKAAGAVPAPFTSYGYYNSDKFQFYGEDLMKRSMAYRSFADAGITAAAGSDFGPGPFAPLMGIQGMVTRTGWNGETWGANQRISVEEALRVVTINGACASYEEALKGSITAGKLADFVVLAEDPHTVDPSKIKDIAIVRTVTGGNTVYQA
jgi:predicted amidohydrolase YtcJ